VLKNYRAELHVHTVLSPCADVEMIPPLIIQFALDRGISLLAITDHNASANVEAVMQAARGLDISVLPGMEVQTREEVHMLCLFDDLDQIRAWQKIVDANLPDMQNDTDHFGEQFVVDYSGEFIRREERLLLNSTHLTLDDAVAGVQQLGGLAIPAHVNRKAFGLLQMLGFFPPEIPFDAVEISRHILPEVFLSTQPKPFRYPLIQSGDVHLLDDFLGCMHFSIDGATICEIRKAFREIDNRIARIDFQIDKSHVS
jgi:3',5'-nucleoside bisphosphate phosphatase